MSSILSIVVLRKLIVACGEIENGEETGKECKEIFEEQAAKVMQLSCHGSHCKRLYFISAHDIMMGTV